MATNNLPNPIDGITNHVTQGNVLSRVVRSFAPASATPFARRNYQHELVGAILWPIAVSMIEGSVAAVVAQKAFTDTPGWVIATLTAAPIVSNVTSSVWTRFACGQRTISALVAMQIGVLVTIALIALVPISQIGMYIFLGSIIAARMLMAGVITMRSVIWRVNYSRKERARLTGKLITFQTIIISTVTLGLGIAMDFDERAFRIIYPVALLAGFIGTQFFAKIRIRRPFLISTDCNSGKPKQNDLSNTSTPEQVMDRMTLRSAAFVPFGMLAEWGGTVTAMAKVLKQDVAFRGYMVCMFIMGISNLAVMAPLVRMADEQFHLGYTLSIFCLQSLPIILIPIAIPVWAKLFERMHVIRFRTYHSWTFIIAHLLTFAAGYYGSLPLFMAAQAIRGIGFGGGALAWNIGHNDFATRQHAGLYMTIHVTLTGIRGLFGAYIGLVLYSGLVTPWFQFAALGTYSFLFWAGVCLIGAFGFMYLNWKMRSVTHEPASVE